MNVIFKHISTPDWIFFWCLVAIIIIAIAKNTNKKVFGSFIRLAFTNKYLQLYSNHTKSRGVHFWMCLFFVTVSPLYFYYIQFSRGVYEYLELKQCGILLFYSIVFILLKRGIEFFIAASFLKNQGIRSFSYAKQSYLNYLSFIFFLPFILIVYGSFNNLSIIYSLIALFLVLWLLSYVLVLSVFRKQFSYGSFYFILYLCALELAPTCLTYLMILNGIE